MRPLIVNEVVERCETWEAQWLQNKSSNCIFLKTYFCFLSAKIMYLLIKLN